MPALLRRQQGTSNVSVAYETRASSLTDGEGQFLLRSSIASDDADDLVQSSQGEETLNYAIPSQSRPQPQIPHVVSPSPEVAIRQCLMLTLGVRLGISG